MPPDDLVIGDLFPACAADEVLGFEERVAEDGGVGGHDYEVIGGHGFPHFVEERAVVDLASVNAVWGGELGRTHAKGGCNALS